MGTLWDRKAKTFFDEPEFYLVNVLRRVDGWCADDMTMPPRPRRGNPDDIYWTRSYPGFDNTKAVGDLPMYQDSKTRELVLNEVAREIFESCDAPAIFFVALKIGHPH